MVITSDLNLPTEEELTVPEVTVSSSFLKAASFHLGKFCENANNEFMLCRSEYPNDPRKCLKEGKAVTKCSLEFFRLMKVNCRKEFESYANCVDKSSSTFNITPCRKTQKVYDKCMLDKLEVERPYGGYFCEVKVVDSARAPPPPPEPQVFPDAAGQLPENYPREKPKYQARHIFS